MNVVGFKEAGEFLGMHPQTLEQWQRKGVLKYDFKMGYRRFFKKETLESFKEWIDRTMTLKDIADKYGLPWRYVYYCMITKRNVELDDSLHRTRFEKDVVEMIAKAEGWNHAGTTKEVSGQDQRDQREAV